MYIRYITEQGNEEKNFEISQTYEYSLCPSFLCCDNYVDEKNLHLYVHIYKFLKLLDLISISICPSETILSFSIARMYGQQYYQPLAL